jgi:FixJ family two-component response regulator
MSEIPLVAVVDDDASICEALESLLRSVGLRAMVYASAEDFLQSARLQDTACLIVDVHLPRMSGLELQRQVATADGRLPVIFITAHEDAGTRERALRAGAVAFLYKPFSDEALLSAVQGALQSSRGGSKVPRAEARPTSVTPAERVC